MTTDDKTLRKLNERMPTLLLVHALITMQTINPAGRDISIPRSEVAAHIRFHYGDYDDDTINSIALITMTAAAVTGLSGQLDSGEGMIRDKLQELQLTPKLARFAVSDER